MTDLCFISDTHGLHREVKIPKCDILVHCGDITNIGELPVLGDFNDWLGEQPSKYNIVIAGNHDRCFEDTRKKYDALEILDNADYLENTGLEIMGLKFWGSPMTSTLPFWAFAYTEIEDREIVWDKMPKDLDFLITHTPPRGILDGAFRVEPDSQVGAVYKEPVGDPLLSAYIVKNKPKYNIFGHIHESYGHFKGEICDFYNVSQVNHIYRITNPPVVITV